MLPRSGASSFLFPFLILFGNSDLRNSQATQFRQIVQIDTAFDRDNCQLLRFGRDNSESGDLALFETSIDFTDLVLALRRDDLAPSRTTKLRANRFQIFHLVLAWLVK